MFDLDYRETLPLTGKISPAACLGGRTTRALCPCCGGSLGVRKALRKHSRYHKGVRIDRYLKDYPIWIHKAWSHPMQGVKPRLNKNKRERI